MKKKTLYNKVDKELLKKKLEQEGVHRTTLSFYQYAHSYRFKGGLDLNVLLASFQLVAQRHSILRTNFTEKMENKSKSTKPGKKKSRVIFTE